MKKILVIDDEPDITFSLKKVLEENGFAFVDTFNDPTLPMPIYVKKPLSIK
jgi:DNA-binding response OmpR family regulator